MRNLIDCKLTNPVAPLAAALVMLAMALAATTARGSVAAAPAAEDSAQGTPLAVDPAAAPNLGSSPMQAATSADSSERAMVDPGDDAPAIDDECCGPGVDAGNDAADEDRTADVAAAGHGDPIGSPFLEPGRPAVEEGLPQ